ncbi:urease subunit beta [Trichocoleus sp. FACHB-40]|nr:urease subunit beta [Trichocoleus sp. FACHB-40]MBD2007034.1 urease subunit beta [Trichocoleus sp. FACHB-40]
MIPGEIIVQDGEIELNTGRPTLRVIVANSGDRLSKTDFHHYSYEVYN